jgi:hypothetical protein
MALLLVFLIDYRYPAAATDVSYLYNELERANVVCLLVHHTTMGKHMYHAWIPQ